MVKDKKKKVFWKNRESKTNSSSSPRGVQAPSSAFGTKTPAVCPIAGGLWGGEYMGRPPPTKPSRGVH